MFLERYDYFSEYSPRLSSKRGAPKGNKNAVKLKNSALKTEAYRQFCEHVANGKSKEEWRFAHPCLSLTYKSLRAYMKNEEEFPPIKLEIAECKGFQKWEQIVEDAAIGKNRLLPAFLQAVMRNKFGWI